jgi:2-C-methyl-D-erythritol 4-phosphate cytidylyltransferase
MTGPRAVGVIIAAGGVGRRMGGVRKQYLELLGEPILLRALRPFLGHPAVHWVVVALPAGDAADPPAWLAGIDPRVRIVAGGTERTDSVRAALAALPPDCETVLVHDAARPLVTPEIIERTLLAAGPGRAVVAGIAVEDTVKQVDAGRVVATLDRTRLWQAQTPQAFPRQALEEAHAEAAARGMSATDDAALVEALGLPVVVVEGSRENLKVTGPLDLVLAEAILRARGR